MKRGKWAAQRMVLPPTALNMTGLIGVPASFTG